MQTLSLLLDSVLNQLHEQINKIQSKAAVAIEETEHKALSSIQIKKGKTMAKIIFSSQAVFEVKLYAVYAWCFVQLLTQLVAKCFGKDESTIHC